MFRLLRLILLIVVIAVAVFAVTGYKINGKTIQDYYHSLSENKEVKEGMKDLRVLVGEAIKAVGEEMSDTISDEDREKMEDLVKKELEEGKKVKK